MFTHSLKRCPSLMKFQKFLPRPAVSYGTQHHCEYYVYVEPRGGKEGSTDESGKSFVDETVSDAKGDGELNGHKIVVKMVDSSLGPKGRSGMFTFDYNKGLVNIHEEVFNLGVNRNIVDKPNNVKYAFGGKEWHGKPSFLEALKNDENLRLDIIKELKLRDMVGAVPKLADEA